MLKVATWGLCKTDEVSFIKAAMYSRMFACEFSFLVVLADEYFVHTHTFVSNERQPLLGSLISFMRPDRLKKCLPPL